MGILDLMRDWITIFFYYRYEIYMFYIDLIYCKLYHHVFSFKDIIGSILTFFSVYYVQHVRENLVSPGVLRASARTLVTRRIIVGAVLRLGW